VLFLVSATEIISDDILSLFNFSLVIHGSDLPQGRGWSPVTWQVLEGKKEIKLSLFEAANPVDTGGIWKKIDLKVEDNALFPEIMQAITNGTLELMDFALLNLSDIRVSAQIGQPTYYPRRALKDSELFPEQTIGEIFNLIRICDPKRYPAFFTLKGRKFKLLIEAYED